MRHKSWVLILLFGARMRFGASVRNFGFVTVTGQAAGITWRRARRSRDMWAELAPLAGIAVLQRGLLVAARRQEAFPTDVFGVRDQLVEAHGAGFDGAAIIFPDAFEVFLGDRADFFRRLFFFKTHRQIFQRNFSMARVNPERQRAASAPDARDDLQRQRLNNRNERSRKKIKKRIHFQRKQILRTQS